MIRLVMVAILMVALAGCADDDVSSKKSVKHETTAPRYARVDASPCVSVDSLHLNDGKTLGSQYARAEVVPAEVLGTTKDGRCIVIARIDRASDQGCSIDTRIELQESADRIVVRREARRRKNPLKTGSCSLSNAEDPIALRPKQPLADREIVDAISL